MRNIKNMKTLMLTTICLSMVFTSCLKSNDPSEDYSKSPALVGFQYYGFSAKNLATSLLPNPVDTVNVEVTLSVSTITLTSPVTVTIEPYSQGVDSLNAEDTAAHYTMLSSEFYTLGNDGKVTINPGEQIVKLPVYIKASTIDFTTNPVLSLRITGADGAVIASNLSVANLVLLLKNIYDGEYSVTGSFTDTFLPVDITDDGVYPIDVYLITTGTKTDEWYDVNNGYYHLINSDGAIGVYGEFSPVFIFDDNNNVVAVGNYYGSPTIFDPSAGRVRSAQLDPSGVNQFDPVTKTLKVSYILVQSGSPRTYFDETFTYVGPRP